LQVEEDILAVARNFRAGTHTTAPQNAPIGPIGCFLIT
jgi:hypothetical protein